MQLTTGGTVAISCARTLHWQRHKQCIPDIGPGFFRSTFGSSFFLAFFLDCCGLSPFISLSTAFKVDNFLPANNNSKKQPYWPNTYTFGFS